MEDSGDEATELTEPEVVNVNVVMGAECLNDARAIGAGSSMECDETGAQDDPADGNKGREDA